MKLIFDKKVSVVFVLGLYKTGTSLMVEVLSKKGYVNVALQNNKLEHANGLSRKYITNECKEVRFINRLLIEKLNQGQSVFSNELILKEMTNYLIGQDQPFVVKDPRFVYCLHHWTSVCIWLNMTFKVYVTNRPFLDIWEAWNLAYFTRQLLIADKRHLTKMQNALNYQKKYLNSIGQSFKEYSLQEMLNIQTKQITIYET